MKAINQFSVVVKSKIRKMLKVKQIYIISVLSDEEGAKLPAYGCLQDDCFHSTWVSASIVIHNCRGGKMKIVSMFNLVNGITYQNKCAVNKHMLSKSPS